MQVRIARSAETDLLEGYAFYEQQQAGIGEYFLDSLFADIDAWRCSRALIPSRMGACIARWRSVFRLPSITKCGTTSLPSWQCSTAGRTQRRSRND